LAAVEASAALLLFLVEDNLSRFENSAEGNQFVLSEMNQAQAQRPCQSLLPLLPRQGLSEKNGFERRKEVAAELATSEPLRQSPQSRRMPAQRPQPLKRELDMTEFSEALDTGLPCHRSIADRVVPGQVAGQTRAEKEVE
jgi:hypothetical protein